MEKIIHLSDLHFGKFDPETLPILLETIRSIKPALVIISGDFTQRARVTEYKEARNFLNLLKKEKIAYFVTPGNHDIQPIYRPFFRMLRPYSRFKKYISPDLDSFYMDDKFLIAGINTVKRRLPVKGRVSSRQLRKVVEWLSGFKDNRVRIVVTHHPIYHSRLIWPRKMISRSYKLVERLGQQKVDIFLSGHHHLTSSANFAQHHSIEGRRAVFIQAGTVSKRLRGESASFNVLSINKPEIKIEVYGWNSENKKFEVRESKVEFIGQ